MSVKYLVMCFKWDGNLSADLIPSHPILIHVTLSQAPQKPDELEEEFDATLEGDDCIQMSRSRPGTIGSEDCLYVNVYVPKV